MATAPVKSQPLHNFPLSFLQWGHRCRRPTEPTSTAPEEESGAANRANDKVEEGDREEERAWNLRPRRAAKAPAEIEAEGAVKSARLRGVPEGHVAERKVLWIALSREEIEEDMYAMTGGRPTRRVKKRSKTVQKQVDKVFPGLYLDGLTADAYRVHEPTK